MSGRPGSRPGLALAVSFASVALVASFGCREVGTALGGGPSGARGAEGVLVALASRFGPIEREASFDAARPRFASAALAPSRVFDEESLWTAMEGEWRQVEFFGEGDTERYRVGIRASVPPPDAVGEYRGRLRLHREDKGRYEWAVREELSLGPALPADLSAALTALLRSGEGVSGQVARARAREVFPRATAAFSRLFDLETLDLAASGGATSVRVSLVLRPEGIQDFSPRYAAFLRKFVPPMQLRVEARDAHATWWTIEAEQMRLTLRLRTMDGRLVPLEGDDRRRVGDRLRLGVDYSTKQGLFRVGVRDLVADVALVREPHTKAMIARFQEQPDWRLPFLIEPLMRGSLRHPFEEGGIEVAWSLRGAGDGPTLAVREYRLRVRESWIVRWLGGLSDQAVSEFRRGAEAESDRFSRECLLALRDDVAAALGRAR